MNQQMRKNNNRAEFRKSLGLVLVFVGMQFNTAIKNVILGICYSLLCCGVPYLVHKIF